MRCAAARICPAIPNIGAANNRFVEAICLGEEGPGSPGPSRDLTVRRLYRLSEMIRTCAARMAKRADDRHMILVVDAGNARLNAEQRQARREPTGLFEERSGLAPANDQTKPAIGSRDCDTGRPSRNLLLRQMDLGLQKTGCDWREIVEAADAQDRPDLVVGKCRFMRPATT
jgi:hypothetical protein